MYVLRCVCFQESSNLSLVSRLQMRIKQLEWERALLRREVDRKDAKIDGGGKSGDDLEKEIYESIKVLCKWIFRSCTN